MSAATPDPPISPQPAAEAPPVLYRLVRLGMRLFFYLLYQPLAWTYDAVAAFVSAGLWKNWVVSVLPELAGSGPVLELGHGPGHLQLALNRLGRPAFGLDRSPQMGRQARRRLLRQAQPARLARGLAQRLPFCDQAFPFAVSTFPTEYFLHPDTLAEVYRVLAPGGRWVVLPVAWVTGGALRQRFAALLLRVTGESPPYEDQAWIDAYAQIFRRAGFTAQARRVSLPGSEVLLVIAEKPAEKPAERPAEKPDQAAARR